MIRWYAILILSAVVACGPALDTELADCDTSVPEFDKKYGRGALLLSRFSSFDELREVISIEYSKFDNAGVSQQVVLRHCSDKREVASVLHTGVNERNFHDAIAGTIWDKAMVGLRSPFAFVYRQDLRKVEELARRKHHIYGESDVAFYDIAQTTVLNIIDEDQTKLSEHELSEKGYLNTFNHITAQALITTLYSERTADFVADVHERYYMPSLISGDFSEASILDLDMGPVDNYIDVVNNEWGQELGKELKSKYGITRQTLWTPKLLADYLNEMQNYYSRAFEVGFAPFRPSDELVLKFVDKVNRVNGLPGSDPS